MLFRSVLDEPVSGLDVSTALALRAMVRALADAGRIIFYSSHELDTVEKISTRVIILRSGKVVATYDLRATHVTQEQLALDIVGAALPAARPDARAVGTEPALTVRDVTVTVDGRVSVDAVSLTLHPGEVLGIAGVAGNGQAEDPKSTRLNSSH